MFGRILLATDGSSHAEKALEYARDLALREDAQVIVVHAFEPVPGYLGEPWGDRVIAHSVAAGRKTVNDAAEQLRDAGLEVVVELLEGPPADAILRVADTRQPDLIVMGSRGRGELASLLLGSVSHRVLAHTCVPALVVRTTEKGSD